MKNHTPPPMSAATSSTTSVTIAARLPLTACGIRGHPGRDGRRNRSCAVRPASDEGGLPALLRHRGRCRRLFDVSASGSMAMVSSASSSACRLCLRAASNAERSMPLSAGAPPAFRSSWQRGEHLGLVAHAGLLNGRAAERQNICIGQKSMDISSCEIKIRVYILIQ